VDYLKITMALLEREGLGHLLGHCWPLLAQSLPLGKGQTDRQVVAAMWDVKQLANSYKKFSSIYQPLIAEWLSLGSKPTNNHMEKAFWLRLLLIHDFRRLLLRDPSLPLNLLPAQWPGQAARQTCMALYGLLRPASEKYLDLHVQLADGQLTSSRKVFAQRFKKC
jgi:phenylacetic acid degradation operon negative regulatory protein